MRLVKNIWVFILSGFILLSVSGLKFHFHYCGHHHVLYTSVGLIQDDPVGKSCSCDSGPETCSHSATKQLANEQSKKSQCLDFEEDIKTDVNYLTVQFSISTSPAVLELFEIKTTGLEKDYSRPVLVSSLIFHPPPEPELISVFRL